MDQDKIDVGGNYAYVESGTTGVIQPVRATPNGEPTGGYVEITVYFPDGGQDVLKVKTRELVGKWDEEATGKQLAALGQRFSDRGQTMTWADVAAIRYEEVKRQRALAQRLMRFGIKREGRPYAGRGGSSTKPHDADIQLNYDELESLLDAAERGPGASTSPFTGALTPVGGGSNA